MRRATRDDVPAIVAIYRQDYLGAGREFPGDEALPDYLAAFDEIAADPERGALYVADLDGRVVGTMRLTILRHLTHRGARVAQIEAVHVVEEMRGRGHGAAMMRFVLDEARHRGCRRAQLTSNKSRTDAHRFYARLGFVASHEGMKLVL